MINHSVGKKASNQARDVRVIQQVLNARHDLISSKVTLNVDGVYGSKTQTAIDDAQSRLLSRPDGVISPKGFTIKQLWPLAYANPTGKNIRTQDAYGEGHHGAPRGSRVHDGADYVSIAGQAVMAPISGVVNKISRPYASGIDAALLSGVHIVASDGSECWVWYMLPTPNIIGTIVSAGKTKIGTAKTLKNRYTRGITDHVHLRIHGPAGKKVNPASVIK